LSGRQGRRRLSHGAKNKLLGSLATGVNQLRSLRSLLSVPALGVVFLFALAPVSASDFWAKKVGHRNTYLFQECTNWFITSVCTTLKDYEDQGVLQSPIAVGDLLTVPVKTDTRRFHVRSIRVDVAEKDVDFTHRGKRVVAKKGDITCTLYDVPESEVSQEYLTRLILKNCEVVERSAPPPS
jgi:hypothetical protein